MRINVHWLHQGSQTDLPLLLHTKYILIQTHLVVLRLRYLTINRAKISNIITKQFNNEMSSRKIQNCWDICQFSIS